MLPSVARWHVPAADSRLRQHTRCCCLPSHVRLSRACIAAPSSLSAGALPGHGHHHQQPQGVCRALLSAAVATRLPRQPGTRHHDHLSAWSDGRRFVRQSAPCLPLLGAPALADRRLRLPTPPPLSSVLPSRLLEGSTLASPCSACCRTKRRPTPAHIPALAPAHQPCLAPAFPDHPHPP